ncbi:hypothetical protein CNY89_30480, partial [Amaricoccus sp. HAR-UPW-R2A-40]
RLAGIMAAKRTADLIPLCHPLALTRVEVDLEPLGVARLAGIMAAKRTADLIPLCHPLALTRVEVDLEP